MKRTQDTQKRTHLRYHIACVLAVTGILAAATGASLLLQRMGVETENLLMLFLIGVLLTSVMTRGYVYGFVSSVLSVFLFNYFFTQPYHTFVISDKQDLLLLLFFLIAALISGLISSQLRQRTIDAQNNAHAAQLMYEMSERFLNLTGEQRIVENMLERLASRIGCACRVELDEEDPETKRRVFYSRDASGDTCDWTRAWQLPIRGLTKSIGTLFLDTPAPLAGQEARIVRAAAYQTALALDREYIYRERERIRIAMEHEQVKSTLLRSVSHDIRTPLTGIIGASNVLMEHGETLEKADVKKLAGDIRQEAEWLMLTVQNILHMTRISEGQLQINASYESADDLIDQTMSRLPFGMDRTRIDVKLPDQICLVFVDGNLFVQVLLNLIDNAFKHAGAQAHVTLRAYAREDTLIFEVSDDGNGIDEALLPHVFEGFVTKSTHAADKGRGVGLGLCICEAIVQAHGGQIQACNRQEGGACFTVSLSCETQG